MTEILLVCDENGLFKSLSASGHAGFSTKGKDIVCAGISILLDTAMEVLLKTEGIVLEKEIACRGKLAFHVASFESVVPAKERLKCIADFIRQGINSLTKDYPAYVLLREIKQ